jgi:hypothetical protein
MRKHFRLLGLLTSLVLAACGGGGGGSSGAAPTSFALSDPVFEQVGGSRTFNLTGSRSDGQNLTAVWSLARRADTTFDGQPARQLDQLISITFVGTGQTDAVSVTTYTDAAGNFLGAVNNDTLVEAFPDGPQTTLPVTAVIGDFGSIGDVGYTDGSSTTSNWRLDAHPGSSTRADLITFISFISPTVLNFDSQLTRIIDSSGNTIGGNLSYFFENGLTVDLST